MTKCIKIWNVETLQIIYGYKGHVFLIKCSGSNNLDAYARVFTQTHVRVCVCLTVQDYYSM